MRGISIIIILFFVACSIPKKQKHSNISILNIDSIIDIDIRNNQKQQMAVHKTIEVNTKKDETIEDVVDWNKQFALLKTLSINKPKWKDKYKLSVDSNDSKKIITYSATTDKLPIKKVQITYSNNTAQKIEIIKQNNNFIFRLKQQIEYIPTQEFTISTEQKSIFYNDFITNVRVQFIKK